MKALDYPITLTGVRRGRYRIYNMRTADLRRLLQAVPPDYCSKNGRVRRWKSLPAVRFGIYGQNAQTLHIRPVLPGDQARAKASLAYCQVVLRRSAAQWFSLPNGREIESVAASMPPSECPEKGPALPL